MSPANNDLEAMARSALGTHYLPEKFDYKFVDPSLKDAEAEKGFHVEGTFKGSEGEEFIVVARVKGDTRDNPPATAMNEQLLPQDEAPTDTPAQPASDAPQDEPQYTTPVPPPQGDSRGVENADCSVF